MKLIHTADLHLDSPICGTGSFEAAGQRRSELLRTFLRIVRLADERGASAILIAGDMFDSDNSTQRAYNYVKDVITSNPQIDFYYLRGNHDKSGLIFDKSEQLPDNYHLFGRELTTYRLSDDVMLHGSEDPYTLADVPSFDVAKVNIAMLHGDIKDLAAGFDSRTTALPIERFAHKNLDYIALGHIHSKASYQLDERTRACYSGCPNGRGYDECGEKGVFLLDIDGKRVNTEFVLLSDRIYHSIDVDISGIPDMLGCLRAVRAAVADIPERDAVRITLIGERAIDLALDKGVFVDALDGFFDVRVHDETKVVVDEDEILGEISLRGEFLRLVYASDMDDEAKKRVMLCGLAALSGEVMPF